MELWTGALSWRKCHWPDLNSDGLFRRNFFWTPLKPQHSNPNPLANQLKSIDFLTPPTLLIIPHMSSLNLLCHSETDARFMQDVPKAVWSIPYVSVAFFSSLKQNFIAYRSSKVSDCIYQLWQSGFSKAYSNFCCSCSFEPEIIKIGQSSLNIYSNNILNFQESTTILNACTKKNLETYRMPHVFIWEGIMSFKQARAHLFEHKLYQLLLLIGCTQLKGFKYCYPTVIILFNISHLFAHSSRVSNIDTYCLYTVKWFQLCLFNIIHFFIQLL